MKKVEIKVGHGDSFFPLKNLKHSLVNRDIVDNHSDVFIQKIKEEGFMSPIIIDSKGNILEGHHRALAAEKLGLKTVPVYITPWVDTSNRNEYQRTIIGLNNSNRKWSALDYLKSYSENKKTYNYTYKKYLQSDNGLSVGNVLNIYFNAGSSKTFKNGSSKIKDKDFSDYLYDNILRLRKKYSSKSFQAVTVNRLSGFAHQKINGNKKELDYILQQLEELAIDNSPTLSSVEHLRPYLNRQLLIYRSK